MNPDIFREYDIRGVVDEDISDSDVLLIAKGIGTYLQSQGKKRIVQGRDCRLSGDTYGQLVTEGLRSSGCDVLDIGVCPTPVSYFAIWQQEAEGSVMITASHNPPEYNGFKICCGHDTLFGDDIQAIRRIVERGEFSEGKGGLENVDVVAPYQAYILGNIDIEKHLRVGIDAGNGTAGVLAVPILKNLGCEVFDLYCDMDGNFPNHEPDPTVVDNMGDLIKLVKDKGLDVGIGYDGDGDRIGVVNEKGDIIWGDQLMIVFSREILSRKPGSTFISEVKCSKTLYDDIEKHGGQAVMWKTGHSLIKKKMKEIDAELAGEMSGHIFFNDRYFGFDDAVYATCRLLEILSATNQSLSELLIDVPQTYATPEIRVPCSEKAKFSIVKEVAKYFRSRSIDFIDIDGVRVLHPDGWGLVRASNTQPVLVMRFEALSRGRLDEIRTELETVVKNVRDRF